ncbi:hypothetical protein HBHAL_7003 (plasmid) [Halobacillus halophilus DSM 2266]|uniref:Uncharacterized protein n=1 Tax=Halobacillus halophilus (strain ATCC 35676 / DSM 2266 / JCM 20832 / KCTC 3685 / LMG 17431 / NBRC 102448 / NCIMB 2269) TaxID=866895 RepID=I0JTP9_HALH3|nr:hypothetical protein HBHAL_7003 [Halobacillus halophilus DSM 2266]
MKAKILIEFEVRKEDVQHAFGWAVLGAEVIRFFLG